MAKLDAKTKIGLTIMLASLVLFGVFCFIMSRSADGTPDWNDPRAQMAVIFSILMIVSLLYVGLRALEPAVASEETEVIEEPQDAPKPMEEPKKKFDEEVDYRPRYEKIVRP